ncbi:MAG TPA: hypothetical protein VL443_11050 [Cyclobacteriaceae bacterium]|nr:hypothetical protein [Cyclobacteriaceae bacterium]
MKKLLIIVAAVLIVLIALSSCSSFDACPTYTNSSLKQYGPKYTYAHAKTNKKAKKTKIW